MQPSWIRSWTIVAGMAVAVSAAPPDRATLDALGGQSGSARVEASEALVASGAPAVGPLIALLDEAGKQPTAAKMAFETLLRMTSRHADTPEGEAIARKLAAALTDTHTVETRRQLCRLLSLIGGDESVDALAETLGDADVQEMARWALVRMPGGRATRALMNAVAAADAPFQVALINGLAQRGDPDAVPVLADRALEADDEAVREAAVAALGQMPTEAALAALQRAAGAGQPGAVDAMLELGARARDTGRRELVAEILAALDPEGLSDGQTCRLLYVWTDGDLNAESLLNGFHAFYLQGEAPVRNCFLDALSHARVDTAFSMLLTLMTDMHREHALKTAEGRITESRYLVDLLDVIARREPELPPEYADDPNLALLYAPVIRALRHEDDAVRRAAIRAVEQAGIEVAVPELIALLRHGDEAMRFAAEHALCRVPGLAASERIAEAVPDVEPEVRVRLLLALGHRDDHSGLFTIVKATEDEDVHVRAAAYRALGLLQVPQALDLLMRASAGPPGPDRDAAEGAMRRLEGDEATARMLDAYEKATEAQKPPLLRVIALRKHRDIPALLAREVNHAKPGIRAAAVRGLGLQDDPTVAPALLAVAKEGPAEVTEAAIDGYFQAARRAEGASREAAAGMYAAVLELDVSHDQTREALHGLARTIEPARQADLLDRIVPLLDAAALSREAAAVAGPIAIHLPEGRRDEATDILLRVVRIRPGDDVTHAAVDRLQRLGVDIDPAHEAGFITRWWLVGPFPNPNNTMFDIAYFPEQEIRLDGRYEIEDTVYTWKPHHTRHLSGVVDLERVIAREDHVGAYALSEITVDAARDVVLRVGSDDGIIIWINGERVHANKVNRGLTVDQDEAAARLRTGTNTVLVKILQALHAWEFCIRITTPDGEPVAFRQMALETE